MSSYYGRLGEFIRCQSWRGWDFEGLKEKGKVLKEIRWKDKVTDVGELDGQWRFRGGGSQRVEQGACRTDVEDRVLPVREIQHR